MFFFSSRRRHTRYIGDWSSDVCSSDLFPFGDRADHHQRIAIVNGPAVVAYVARERIAGRHAQRELGAALRSEERRVGKECRTRVAPAQQRITTPSFEHRLCYATRDDDI